MNYTSVFYYLAILTVAVTTVAQYSVEDEGDYMHQFLKALTRPPTGWSNNTHHCKWNGITCRSNRVTTIKLPSSSLVGTVPISINTLINLTHLDLRNNSLTGPLPDLNAVLQTVDLSHNNFTSIDSFCFSYMLGLRTLNISNNLNLIAWVFPDLHDSKLLHTIDFEATNLIGSLPPDMFELLPSLDTIVLSHNNLSGLLPPSLGNSNVTCLRLNDQGKEDAGFTGSITIIASMRLLAQAWLNGNHLTDSIPASFASTKLFDLQLRSNSLTGLVPRSLFNLISLKEISLDHNILQGPVPMFDKHIKATWESNMFCRSDVGPCDPQVTIIIAIFESFSGNPLFLQGNHACADGVVIMCQRGKVVSLDLASPFDLVLTGTISPVFANLTSLVNLNLSGNNLTGPIPEILTTLSHLKLLDVSNNNLSGPIPKFPSKVKVITRGNVLLGQFATSPNGDQSKPTRLRIILIAGACLFSVGLLILIAIICIWKMYPTLIQRGMFKKTLNPNKLKVQYFIERCNLSPIKQYSYADVKRMTNSFQEKLGKGGFAVVYKAILPEGRPVAVKIIDDAKGDGQDFMNELDSISRTAHVNIVSLLGFCYEHKIALIYEFMSKGSLDKFILNTGLPDGICSLDWNILCKIAIGIAKGLDYLHQGCASRIVHLDIKPHNILLDDDFCPKIADFGLAKICQKNVSAMSGGGGTRGYMAPEIFRNHKVSEKADIYSYGMLIIDMIGRRYNNTGGSHTSESFADGIYNDLQQGNNLVNSFEISEEENDTIRKITMVCLWCIQFKASDRPSSGRVVEMLQGSLESIPFPPKPSLSSEDVPSFPSPSSRSLIESKSASLMKTGSIKSDRFVSCTNENGDLGIE